MNNLCELISLPSYTDAIFLSVSSLSGVSCLPRKSLKQLRVQRTSAEISSFLQPATKNGIRDTGIMVDQRKFVKEEKGSLRMEEVRELGEV